MVLSGDFAAAHSQVAAAHSAANAPAASCVGLYHEGRLAQLAGKLPQALAAYQQVADKHAGCTLHAYAVARAIEVAARLGTGAAVVKYAGFVPVSHPLFVDAQLLMNAALPQDRPAQVSRLTRALASIGKDSRKPRIEWNLAQLECETAAPNTGVAQPKTAAGDVGAAILATLRRVVVQYPKVADAAGGEGAYNTQRRLYCQ
jgi:hypothetical protein